ncbi:MAG: response regulator [Candidatus Peribacteraceae bacterium]|nr:response regulator [Candidatus Peribacteraceae bacterium]MDD5743038.1 response regulator [Candidatus Peribacteraceae bacterium]
MDTPLHQSFDAAQDRSVSAPVQGKPCFLIADDTPGKQNYLRALFKKSGFPAEVVLAHSTKESEDLIAQMPNIIGAFVDYRMPQEGGIPVVEMLRRTHPHARIALITASTGETPEREAAQAGVSDYISTAYPEQFVTEKILKLLGEWKGAK